MTTVTITASTQDTFESTYTGASNGETFILEGNNLTATIFQLSSNNSFIYGTDNSMLLNGDGPESVFDRGQGTHLTVADPLAQVNVYGFQFDRTGSFTEMFTTTAALQASMRPDGHGGTIVGTGGAVIDFIGDTHVSASQLHGVMPV
jgi:hypothetical protein